ncbi:MAG: glycosyltransferase family 2 protein [Ruminococcaceae bacterium]|nr:glycosyltransferase family 2 protein [Oscillospiraceae bacterium]
MSAIVSIIVPVYNVEKQLSRCIESLLAQTYKDLEILLVDDGSTDSSGALCDAYAKKDSRIQVFHKENGGVSSARNLVLPLATGTYLLFLDGDDALDPDTVEKCVAAAEDGGFDAVCFGYHHYLEKTSGAVELLREDAKTPCDLSKADLISRFSDLTRAGIFDFITDKLFRLSLIQQNHLQFDSYFNMGGEDGVFMLSLLPHLGNLRVINDCFYRYFRREGQSATLSFRKEKFDRYYKRLELTYAFMQENGCFDESFLCGVYCSNVLWVYDSLFSETCRLSLGERKKFLKTAFQKSGLYPGFAAAALAFATGQDFAASSRGSRKALLWILQKKYTRLFLLHCLQLFKFNLSRKRR